MKCQRCTSNRVASFTAKCSDRFAIKSEADNIEHTGYVPSGIGIGDSSDYVEALYCLECGQLQGELPIALETMVLQTARAPGH